MRQRLLRLNEKDEVKLNLEEVQYSSIDFNTKSLHHKKRTRAVFRDSNYHYKLWEFGWEHGKVARDCIKIGYYDKKIVPAFVSMIVHDGLDVGYIMKSGKVMGASRGDWQELIKQTTREQRLIFLHEVLQRSLKHSRIISDMVPSNIIVFEGQICCIDLEGVESFSWIFNGVPEPHEAQNRNLNKVSKPYWKIMSDYTKLYMDQCLGLSYQKSIDSADRLAEAANIVEEAFKEL